MDNEILTKLQTMVSGFEKRQKEIQNEIDNISKSTRSIQNNILKEFEVVEDLLRKDLETLFPIFNSIRNKKATILNAYTCSNYEYFSVFLAKKVKHFATVFFWVCERNEIYIDFTPFEIIYGEDGLRYKVNPDHNNGELSDADKENIIKFYYTGDLYKQTIECLERQIDYTIEELNEQLATKKSIIENAEPVSEKDSHWSDYIMYLLKWSSEHSDNQFSGMSPSSYDEWLDNDMEAEND